MEIGSKVAFINENLKGIVTRFIDQRTVGVEIEDGFEIPVLKSELVLLDMPQGASKPDAIGAQTKTTSTKLLGFIFNMNQQSGPFFQPALINATQEKTLFTAYLKSNDQWIGLAHGTLLPQTETLLPLLNTIENAGAVEYHFGWMVWNDKMADVPHPYSAVVKVKPTDLRQIIELNTPWEKKLENQIWYASPRPPITDESKEIIKQKEPETNWESQVERPNEVIDLHLEALLKTPIDNIGGEEALLIQIDAFEKAFEKAVAFNMGKLTAIHGLGTGELKFRIRKIISGHRMVKSFRDAQKEKFGYGATEIFFK